MMLTINYSSAILCITTLISISLLWLFNNNKKKKANQIIPTKWRYAGRVGKIVIYPIKSASPKEIQQAACTEIGLKELGSPYKYLFRDRSFLIYDSNKLEVFKVLKHRKGILLRVESKSEDELVFQAPEFHEHFLKLSDVLAARTIVKNIKSYDVSLEILDCGDDIATWVTAYLTGKSNIVYRVGFFAEGIVSRPDPVSAISSVNGSLDVFKHWRKSDGGIYSWLTSYMILSSASVADVNERLPPDDQFTFANLRPNIVVDGCDKYAEDDWSWVKIGDQVILRSFKLCTRCMHITVDPYTATRNSNMEPFRTLKSYRRMEQIKGIKFQGDLPVLGVNMGLYVPGEIQIGDSIYVA